MDPNKPPAMDDPSDGDVHDDPEHDPGQDAEHLKWAAEVQADPKRHAAAAKHLQKHKDIITAAHKNSRKMLEKKVGAKLKNVFNKGKPSADDAQDQSAGSAS